MDLLSLLRNPRAGKPRRHVAVRGLEGLPPDVRAALQAQADHLRMNGRSVGEFSKQVGKEVMESGAAWPRVLEDEATGTSTVPATFEGLLAIVASWDSLLLDEELQVLRNVTAAMVPAGLIQQDKTRRRRAEQKAHEAHMREHHPEEWTRSQGWMV
jgi:hypothetical protein